MEINVNVTAEKVVTDKKFVAAGNQQIKLKLELSSDFDNLVVRVVLNNKSVTVLNGECYCHRLKQGATYLEYTAIRLKTVNLLKEYHLNLLIWLHPYSKVTTQFTQIQTVKFTFIKEMIICHTILKSCLMLQKM